MFNQGNQRNNHNRPATAAKSEIVADWREEYVRIYKGNLNLFLHNL